MKRRGGQHGPDRVDELASLFVVFGPCLPAPRWPSLPAPPSRTPSNAQPGRGADHRERVSPVRARTDGRSHCLCFFHSSVKPRFSIRCSTSSNLIMKLSNLGAGEGQLALLGIAPRPETARPMVEEQPLPGFELVRWYPTLFRFSAARSSVRVAPRRQAPRAGSLPGVVDFRLSRMSGLLGCRHLSRDRRAIGG